MSFSSFNGQFSLKTSVVKESDAFGYDLIKQYKKGQKMRHRVKSPSLIMDIVLDEALEIDGIIVNAGSWRIDHQFDGIRTVVNRGNCNGYLISFTMPDNYFSERRFDAFLNKGKVTFPMFYMIFKMLSVKKGTGEAEGIRRELYARGLLSLIDDQGEKKINIRFDELRNIYAIGERLSGCTGKLPVTDELVRLSGLTKTRFQTGFMALFGLSPQKMIQHLRMKRAYEKWMSQKERLSTISEAFDYVHAANFVTAFRAYYGFTPAESVRSNFT